MPTREELLALPQTHPLQTAAVTTAFAVAASARLFPAAWQQAGTAVKALPANLQSSAATAGAAVKALMAPAAPAAALPAAASTGTDSKPLSKVPAAAAKATPAVAGFAPASAQVSLTPAAAAPASAQSRVSAPVIVPAESRPLRAVPSGGGSGAPSSSGNGAAGGASASGASNGASSSSASGQTRYSSVSSVFTPTPASGNGGSGGASQGSNGSAPLAHSLVALKGRLLDAVYNTARGLDASTGAATIAAVIVPMTVRRPMLTRHARFGGWWPCLLIASYFRSACSTARCCRGTREHACPRWLMLRPPSPLTMLLTPATVSRLLICHPCCICCRRAARRD